MSRVSASDNSGNLLTVERGMRVLRAFRAGRARLSNAELVRRTGLPKATVSRLTSTLLQLGFLRQIEGERGYELAEGALDIGHAYLTGNDLLQAAQPFMQALADRLDTSVALAIPDGHDMLYVAYCASSTVATLRLGVGSLLPMASTSIGRAYLWGLPEPQRDALVQQLLQNAGPEHDTLEAAIQTSFSELDTVGVCVVMGAILRGSYGVALPVRLGRQHTLMGLSCGRAGVGVDISSERTRLGAPMREAAEQLESLLADFDAYF